MSAAASSISSIRVCSLVVASPASSSSSSSSAVSSSSEAASNKCAQARVTRSSFPNKTTRAAALLVLACLLGQLSAGQSTLFAAAAATQAPEPEPEPAAWPASGERLPALNYLLFQGAASRPEEAKLEELLKDSNHSHASDVVDIQLANSVWQRMRQNALDFARQRAHEVRPTINRLLEQANVSKTCASSLNDLMSHVANLETWAVQMYNAFGDFPSTGIFEGSLNSMGSYHQCVNVEPNEWIGQAQYCTFKFQPIVPKRPKFHNILAGIENLANFTSSSDMFREFAKKAQYFYYIKLRLATCMPSKCEQFDLERLAKQIAVNTYLQYSGLSCLQKEEGFNPDGAQLFALTVLISMASLTFLGTLIHLLDLRALLRRSMGAAGQQAALASKANKGKGGCGHLGSNQAAFMAQQQQQQQGLLATSPQKVPMLAPTVGLVESSATVNNNNNSLGENNNNNSSSKDLPPPPPMVKSAAVVGQFATATVTLSGGGKGERLQFREKLLSIMNCLVNFSIVKNGRKLFKTSSSNSSGSSGNSRSRVAATSSSRSGSLAPSLLEDPQSPSPSPTSNGGHSVSSANVVVDDAAAAGAGGHNMMTGVCVGGQTCASGNNSDATAAEFESSSLNGPAASTTSSVANTHSDISCVHGMRFWTISWIIFGHTMQYTEWAGFARAYQIEKNIVSFLLQPFLNATFSVDTFFLISGLLTTYVTWSITRGQYRRLNKFAFLISRYLRLTPQVLLVTLIFIVFPMMGDGPYWRGLIQKESDNCKRNWWVSALYLQAFIKQDQICNLVTWWLSIEMFYHFVSIIVIVALLHSTRKGLFAAGLLGGCLTAVSCYLHFVNQYPPNMLPTLPQRYEIWDSIVLKYFWTPFPHAPSYFVGLILGYALYNRSIQQLSRAQVRYGWLAFAFCYTTILFGTYNWNNNAPYSRLSSTAYYNFAQVFWSLSNAWAILACSLGHGGWLNKFLSAPIFVPLGRATYMTYLSHMLIVMAYPAKMNLLIEPSYVVILYIFLSNLILSYALGITLTLIYESPMLHLQKMIVRNMINKFNDDTSMSAGKAKANCHPKNDVVQVILYAQPMGPTSKPC